MDKKQKIILIVLFVCTIIAIVIMGMTNSKSKSNVNTSKTSVTGTNNPKITDTTTDSKKETQKPFDTLPPASNDPEMSIVDNEELQEEMKDNNEEERQIDESIKADLYFYEQLLGNYLTAHNYYLNGSKDFLYSLIDKSGAYYKDKEKELNDLIKQGKEIEYTLIKVEDVEKEGDIETIKAVINKGTEQKKWYKIKKIDGRYVFIAEGE